MRFSEKSIHTKYVHLFHKRKKNPAIFVSLDPIANFVSLRKNFTIFNHFSEKIKTIFFFAKGKISVKT
jgi:hypothetical protein